MYVCICNALDDREVTRVIREGATAAEDIHPRLGCQIRCGRCLPTIIELMDAEINGASDAARLAAE